MHKICEFALLGGEGGGLNGQSKSCISLRCLLENRKILFVTFNMLFCVAYHYSFEIGIEKIVSRWKLNFISNSLTVQVKSQDVGHYFQPAKKMLSILVARDVKNK